MANEHAAYLRFMAENAIRGTTAKAACEAGARALELLARVRGDLSANLDKNLVRVAASAIHEIDALLGGRDG